METSSTVNKFPLQTLLGKIKHLVTEKKDCEERNKSKITATNHFRKKQLLKKSLDGDLDWRSQAGCLREL